MTADSTPRRRRRAGRRAWLVVAVLLVAWGAFAVISVVRARRQADAGLRLLQDMRSHLTPTDLIRGEGLDQLERARRDFERARDSAGSPLLAPFELLPVLGRQVSSVRALTSSAARVVTVGTEAMRASRSQLHQQPRGGPARLALLASLGGIANRSRGELRSVDMGPGRALLGPLARARTRFARELHRLRRALDDVRVASSGLGEMLRGPSQYLVFAANNGEMRAGSGMLLSVGVLTLRDGSFSLGDMQPTAGITLPAPTVPVTGDLAARWGWAEPGREWRNLMMSPRFDASAELATRMWRSLTGMQVNGVLALDPVALRSLLTAEGAVEVDGQRIDQDNVVHYLLYDQYVGVSIDNPVEAARRDRLSRIARATVDGLDQRGWDAATLVDQLRIAGQGRHVLAWSPHPAQQRGWEAAGVAGELHDDSMLVALLNRSGNKMDQFIDVGARLDVTPGRKAASATLHVTLADLAPGDAPSYVIGGFPGTGLTDGQYQGILAVDVPGDAADIFIDGHVPLVAAGADGPARVVATDVRLSRGETRDLVVHFTLPPASRELRVEPSTRVPAVQWQGGGESWTDEAARTVRW